MLQLLQIPTVECGFTENNILYIESSTRTIPAQLTNDNTSDTPDTDLVLQSAASDKRRHIYLVWSTKKRDQ